MRRREFLKSSASVAVFGGLPAVRAAGSEDGAIRGRVTADGRGLANVVVSDGLQCVRTDANGAFALPRREGARFVAMSAPCGYQMKNWYRQIRPDATYDFALERVATGDAKCGCRFVHVADSEICGDNAENRRWIAETRHIAHAERCA